MHHDFKTKSTFHWLRMSAHVCATASPYLLVNMVVESHIVVATSPRASGRVGSRQDVGSQVIRVSVSQHQS
jgi:hypothetical protein